MCAHVLAATWNIEISPYFARTTREETHPVRINSVFSLDDRELTSESGELTRLYVRMLTLT